MQKKDNPKEEVKISKNTIQIRWIQTKLSKLDEHENHYFYAFSRANILLYLGKSHKTFLKQEIKQSLKRLEMSAIGLSIWIGWLFKYDTEHDKEIEITETELINSQLVDDAESLLIYRNKPTYNKTKIKSYRGRVPLTVISKGCLLLKGKITITSNKRTITSKGALKK